MSDKKYLYTQEAYEKLEKENAELLKAIIKYEATIDSLNAEIKILRNIRDKCFGVDNLKHKG